MIDGQDMQRKNQCAQKHIGISPSDGKFLCHTEQIQPDHRQCHTDPYLYADVLFQKDSQYRHQNNVHGRDETCLSNCSVFNADLLQVAGNPQTDAAADPAQDQCFLTRSSSLILPFIEKEDNRKQHNSSDHASDRVEGKRSHIRHSHTLGHKGNPPDHRCQKQQQRAFHICFSHTSTSPANTFL